jgi:hypothetical protein
MEAETCGHGTFYLLFNFLFLLLTIVQFFESGHRFLVTFFEELPTIVCGVLLEGISLKV